MILILVFWFFGGLPERKKHSIFEELYAFGEYLNELHDNDVLGY